MYYFSKKLLSNYYVVSYNAPGYQKHIKIKKSPVYLTQSGTSSPKLHLNKNIMLFYFIFVFFLHCIKSSEVFWNSVRACGGWKELSHSQSEGNCILFRCAMIILCFPLFTAPRDGLHKSRVIFRILY